MKKIFLILMALILAISLCSCGNRSITGIGEYNFKKIHIDTHDFSGCFTIEKWYDNEGSGIEVKTKEVGSIFASEGSYFLIEDVCPFCSEKEGEGK